MEYVEVRKQLIGTGSLPQQRGLHRSTSSHQTGCISTLSPEPSHQPIGKLLKINSVHAFIPIHTHESICDINLMKLLSFIQIFSRILIFV